nr:immunoglobulin light chain junction region [Macaca mulatta]MOW27908.1 immunoglobulin light chain junction region [Macaca mulatta]MOW29329.1 immunoglobulin light chain junction region [Macaca mulatta]MOW30688.1 immunoglobulin light chain junction region [Macaca mulatta]
DYYCCSYVGSYLF